MSEHKCLLKQVQEQELTAKEFGFYWKNFQQIMEQIQSEYYEIQEAHQKKDISNLQEEIGDLIQAAIGLAVFCKFDPSETLLKSIEKFQKRYETLVQCVKEDGFKNLQGQPDQILTHYWNCVKNKP